MPFIVVVSPCVVVSSNIGPAVVVSSGMNIVEPGLAVVVSPGTTIVEPGPAVVVSSGTNIVEPVSPPVLPKGVVPAVPPDVVNWRRAVCISCRRCAMMCQDV